jgi:hypothetical protein
MHALHALPWHAVLLPTPVALLPPGCQAATELQPRVIVGSSSFAHGTFLYQGACPPSIHDVFSSAPASPDPLLRPRDPLRPVHRTSQVCSAAPTCYQTRLRPRQQAIPTRLSPPRPSTSTTASTSTSTNTNTSTSETDCPVVTARAAVLQVHPTTQLSRLSFPPITINSSVSVTATAARSPSPSPLCQIPHDAVDSFGLAASDLLATPDVKLVA